MEPATGATAPPPVLEAQDLVKRYDQRLVLDRVSLRLAPGERVALMGPSGSGKSTLLHCAGGVDRPDSGVLRLAGQDLATLSPAALARLRRRQVGTIFQFFHLLPTLTVAENIELPLQLLGVPRAERQERLMDLLTRVGLADRPTAMPGQLSGGEMQRVAIARALASRPALLLADEPTGNLDSHTGERILAMLAELASAHHAALLLVTHSREATRICQRVLHLRDGQLVAD